MILNFNITGKETVSDMSRIVREAANQFQDEVGTSDPLVCFNTQLVYNILGQHLIAGFIVNEAMNRNDMDVEKAKISLTQELLPKVLESISLILSGMFAQMEEGRASFKNIQTKAKLSLVKENNEQG